MSEFNFTDYADHFVDRGIAAIDLALLELQRGNEQAGILEIERGKQAINLARSLLQAARANKEDKNLIAAGNYYCSLYAAELAQIAAIQRAKRQDIRQD